MNTLPASNLPLVAIVGRPNVGKSTLFNALTRTRDALVADLPGVTRDRQYGLVEYHDRNYILIDTGGLMADAEGIDLLAQKQVEQAVDEADLVLVVFDARSGIDAQDELMVAQLRRKGKPLLPLINKIDGADPHFASSELAALGLEAPQLISAVHRRGIDVLQQSICGRLPPPSDEMVIDAAEGAIKVALIGRPNAGKSTLVNRLIGEERVLASDIPGTTRDSIAVPFQRDGHDFVLIDTAGVRKRAKVQDALEKLTVIKTLQSLAAADVAVMLIDAQVGVGEQDLRLIGQILHIGRPLVIAVNKWDGLEKSQRDRVRAELERRLDFVDYAQQIFISALHGSHLGDLMKAVIRTHRAATQEISSSRLTEVMQQAVQAHTPPIRQGRTASLRYAHVGGQQPLRIVIHGNRSKTIPASYHRYLANRFRSAFKLTGVPLIIDFRDSENPYAGRKNTLSKRQISKRRRLIRHVKGK
ncbi:MAG: ribosome biogenesis GTPase Der [Wenzhouxiangellaceae bacterium]